MLQRMDGKRADARRIHLRRTNEPARHASVNRLLIRSSRRYLLRHPWLAALSVLGVALGVALVVAIDLANTSASRAFELSSASVTGEATHAVVSVTPGGLVDTTYRRLRVATDVRPSAPVVEGYARVADESGRTLHVLGIDPLAEGAFRPYLGVRGVDLGAFMSGGNTALLGRPPLLIILILGLMMYQAWRTFS